MDKNVNFGCLFIVLIVLCGFVLLNCLMVFIIVKFGFFISYILIFDMLIFILWFYEINVVNDNDFIMYKVFMGSYICNL